MKHAEIRELHDALEALLKSTVESEGGGKDEAYLRAKAELKKLRKKLDAHPAAPEAKTDE